MHGAYDRAVIGQKVPDYYVRAVIGHHGRKFSTARTSGHYTTTMFSITQAHYGTRYYGPAQEQTEAIAWTIWARSTKAQDFLTSSINLGRRRAVGKSLVCYDSGDKHVTTRQSRKHPAVN